MKKLEKAAIPTKLPNCPQYLSSTRHERESPESKRIRLEENALENAINQSIDDEERHRTSMAFSSSTELKDKLGFLDTSYWSVVQKDESLIICNIQQLPSPKIVQSLTFASDCEIKVFINDAQIHHLGNYKIPSIINNTNEKSKTEFECK